MEKTVSAASASEELMKIMDYEDFFHYFDFKKGVKKSLELPLEINPDFEDISWWDMYLRWYFVQEELIYNELEKEKADDVAGRLMALAAYHILSGLSCSEEERRLKNLLFGFVYGDIVKTESMQHVLGKLFEAQLEEALYDREYSIRVLKASENTLLDIKEHAACVWDSVRDSVDISRVPEDVEKYVPQEAYKGYVLRLKNDINEMKNFDARIFDKWMGLNVGIHVSPQMHGKTRNKIFEVYFSQKLRFSSEDISMLLEHTTGYGMLLMLTQESSKSIMPQLKF